jgi:hypothetical protein
LASLFSDLAHWGCCFNCRRNELLAAAIAPGNFSR